MNKYMKDLRQLKIWEKSHALTLKVYIVTKSFPKEEIYGITSQIRRAASSIPTNIAEGCGRIGDAELSRFLIIAMGSASELDYLFQLARDLGYIKSSKYEELVRDVIEIKQMLSSFIKKIIADN